MRCFKENGITTEVNVLLHGNCIAWLDTATNDLFVSSCGWETNTTKSRINALLDEFREGSRVIQKNWEWFISDFGQIKPFTDGMKVYWVLIVTYAETSMRSSAKRLSTQKTPITAYKIINPIAITIGTPH